MTRKYTQPIRRRLRQLLITSGQWSINLLLLFYLLFPIYWLMLSSLKTPATLAAVEYLPRNVSFATYHILLAYDVFIRSIGNSLQITGAVLILTLALGLPASYALGRLRFRGRRIGRLVVLGMLGFPQIALLPGLYTMFTDPCRIVGSSCEALSLYNTKTALSLTHLLLTLPLTIWFLAAYFQQLPAELEEAAAIDGATPWQTLIHILVPLAGPGIIATGILTCITSWTEYLFALTLTQTIESRTAIYIMTNFGFNGGGALLTLAASVLITLPVVILALLFQPYVTAGLTGRAADLARVRWSRWRLVLVVVIGGLSTVLLLLLARV
jgi:trehalose/maltose transport system permease protein